MKLKDINKKDFEDFCLESEYDNFFQSKYYAEIKRLDNYHTYFVGLEENGKIYAAALLLSKNISILQKRGFYAPRGFIIDYKNVDLVRSFSKELINYVKEKNGAYLKIDPLITLYDRDNNGNIIEGGINNTKIVNQLKEIGWVQEDGELSYPLEDRILYKLDLNSNEDELFNNFSDDIKKIIETNNNIGITTKKLEKANIQKLIDIIDRSTIVVDNLGISPSNYKEITNILDNHNLLDITVAELNIDQYLEFLINKKNTTSNEEIDKKIEEVKQLQYQYGHSILIGLTLGVIYHNEYYVLMHAANLVDNNLYPLETIYWETIKKAKSMNFNTYNFYEVGDKIENNKMLKEIKGFNGNIVELVGEFNYILNTYYYKRSMKKQKKAYH